MSALSLDEISEVNRRIGELELQIKQVNANADRLLKVSRDFDVLNARHCKILDQEVAEAFDRIKHLELSLFPNLACDIRALHDIIGKGEDRADNPLDHRDN